MADDDNLDKAVKLELDRLEHSLIVGEVAELDRFAIPAMNGLVVSEVRRFSFDELAAQAYKIAAEMVKERNRIALEIRTRLRVKA